MRFQTPHIEPVSPVSGATYTTDVVIERITCASRVSRIEKALAAVPDVSAAAVKLATERAGVRYSAGSVTRVELENAVRASSYDAEERRAAEIGSLRRSPTLAAALTTPLFVMEMGSALSSVFVLGNALRLKRFAPPLANNPEARTSRASTSPGLDILEPAS